MSIQQRIEKYRRSGGAADLVRVEVLVPSSSRGDVLRLAERLRADHRRGKELRLLCDRALSLYGARILDNVDLERVSDERACAGHCAGDDGARGRASVCARARTPCPSGASLVALTDLQRRIMQRLAKNRSETSYLAGGLILNLKAQAIGRHRHLS